LVKRPHERPTFSRLGQILEGDYEALSFHRDDGLALALSSSGSRDLPTQRGAWVKNFLKNNTTRGDRTDGGTGGFYYTASGPKRWDEGYAQNLALSKAVGPRDRPTHHIFE